MTARRHPQRRGGRSYLLSRVYEHTTVLTAVETKNVCLYRSEEAKREKSFSTKRKSHKKHSFLFPLSIGSSIETEDPALCYPLYIISIIL